MCSLRLSTGRRAGAGSIRSTTATKWPIESSDLPAPAWALVQFENGVLVTVDLTMAWERVGG